MPAVSPHTLEDFAYRLLQAGGLATPEALVVAKSLVGANLRPGTIRTV